MLIRPAEHIDLPIILEIMNDIIVNTTTIYEDNIRSYDYVEGWLAKKDQDKMPVLVAEINGQTVGFSSYDTFRPRAAYQFSVEHSVYVHPNFQGQGIGKQLLLALIAAAKKGGYHTMIAGIDAANQKSCDFHLRLGFVTVGTMKEVGYKFGRWLDLVFMQLMLPA